MSDIKRINKAALEYSISAIPRMKKISEPLYKYFGICGFSFMRTYNDCSYLSLLNGYQEYTEKFFETIPKSDPHFIEAIQNTPLEEPHFSLWPSNPKIITPILSLLDAYNIWHGFQITIRKEDYCEMYSFTFDKQSGDKADFFIKNLPFLLEFAKAFKVQALDLIDHQKIKLAVFPEKFETEYSNDTGKTFLYELEKTIKLINLNDKNIRISSQEYKCLELLEKKYSIKNAARELSISPKTVETYLNRMRDKTEIPTNYELIKFFQNKIKF